MINWQEIISNIKSIAIVGETGTGKTALAHTIANSSIKPVYVFKYPKPELLNELGYKNVQSLAYLENMQDCILLIDEPQLYIELYQNKANTILGKILTLCRQRDIIIIIATSDTRFITRGLEGLIDIWIVKDLEYSLIKQGSIIKKIIKDYTFIDANGFRMNNDEFLFYSRRFMDLNGRNTFIKPPYFDEEYSKPYAIKTPIKIPNKTTTKCHN